VAVREWEYRSTEFDADGPRDIVGVTLGLAGNKCFNSLEVAYLQIIDKPGGFVAAIRIDRVDLDPQAVVPVRTPRLRQPGADRP
jgi:hypothetical protein